MGGSESEIQIYHIATCVYVALVLSSLTSENTNVPQSLFSNTTGA
jgi:hypothetical protein